MLKKWNQLPEYMRTEALKPYYRVLHKKKAALLAKRCMDVFLALILLIPLSPIMLVLAIWIKADSRGSVFFRQERITQYGQTYRIYKFRTMVADADKAGPAITGKQDARITKVGKKLRKYRLDEIPQLFNVLQGEMTFVGTRPEVDKYVKQYTDVMYATLLLPAGITSLTSILFKEEENIMEQHLKGTDRTVDQVYVQEVLPVKMKHNLQYIERFGVITDIMVMIRTVFAVIK